jgi:superfamily II DNA helicase RecQ
MEAPRTASSAAGHDTTTRGTCVRRTAPAPARRTAVAASAFVAPEFRVTAERQRERRAGRSKRHERSEQRRRPARSGGGCLIGCCPNGGAPEMRCRFFIIPIQAAEETSQALNQFLATNRILAVDRQFVADGANSAWAICVSFDDSGAVATPRATIGKRGKVDFRDVLSAEEFAVFARLRALRKERAEAEGVPAYALFTNEQLAEIVQRRVASAAELRDVPGVGEARVEKYGAAFLPILQAARLPEATPTDEA